MFSRWFDFHSLYNFSKTLILTFYVSFQNIVFSDFDISVCFSSSFPDGLYPEWFEVLFTPHPASHRKGVLLPVGDIFYHIFPVLQTQRGVRVEY